MPDEHGLDFTAAVAIFGIVVGGTLLIYALWAYRYAKSHEKT